MGGTMRSTYALLFCALLTLAGCGDDQATGNAPPPQQSGGGKWTAQEFSENTERCATGGNDAYQNGLEKWRSYCGCIYGVASQRWTLNEFRNNFSSYFQQLRDDNSHANCVSSSGVTNF